MRMYRSGYYQWLKQPVSNRELENRELLVKIKGACKESNGICGHRSIHRGLKEPGIHVNKKRVARLMSEAKLYGVGTYKRKPYRGAAHKADPNHLQQCFITDRPNGDSWISDITYIRTHEGWLCLATVTDLFSRKIIGWVIGHRQTTTLIVEALNMAVKRLKNKDENAVLHSDQRNQYSSYEYKQFAKKRNILRA